MTDRAAQLEGWTFDVDEVSAGVYRVRGTHSDGRLVEALGTELTALLERCRADARSLKSARRPMDR